METQSPQTKPIRSTLTIQIREPSPSDIEPPGPAPVLDFISSDGTIDRYGEIISANGWRLENYRRNPVFQNAHQYGDVIFTLGRALITDVRTVPPSTLNAQPSTALYQRIQFATDVNPMAKIAYGLYKGKFLNAVSVGFIPLRWKDTDKVAAGRAATGVQATRIYLEQELLEVSAVGIPANPNALVLGLNAGAIEKTDLRDLQDLLKQTLGTPTHEPETVPIKFISPSTADLLRLAKQVRDLLKS
jgi:hypothetical protein